jgi:hypothetical protein
LAIFGGEYFFRLSREEHHFQFYGFDVAPGYSIHEIGTQPDYGVNVIGLWLRGHKAAIDEQSPSGDRFG